jgi:hypothetical protein
VNLDSEFLDSQATKQTLLELEKRFHLIPVAVGGGSMSVVRLLDIDFNMEQMLTMEEARQMAVESAELYLKNINGIRELRPFLAEYPFPVKRLNLSFMLMDPETRNVRKSTGFSLFSVWEGKVRFLRHNEKGNKFEIIHEESFQQASEIVLHEKLNLEMQESTPSKEQLISDQSTQENKNSLAKTFFKKLTSLPGFPQGRHYRGDKYKGTHFADDLFRYLDHQCKRLGKKYDLDLIRIGDFTDSKQYHYYSASFVSDRKFSLQEGRILAAWVFDDFYNILKTDKTVKDYHRRLLEEHPHGAISSPQPDDIDPKEACFKIVFWDDNIDRIMPPHLAQILLLDGVFSYYEADPKTQELRLILKEPYEETLAFRNKLEKK